MRCSLMNIGGEVSHSLLYCMHRQLAFQASYVLDVVVLSS